MVQTFPAYLEGIANLCCSYVDGGDNNPGAKADHCGPDLQRAHASAKAKPYASRSLS